MIFGSDEIYNRIKTALEASDVTIVNDVLRIIEGDLAFLKHSDNMTDEAYEYVIQEVRINVWKKMHEYIRDSENMHPNQRNGWLLKIAENKRCDFYRRKNRKIDENTDSEWQLVDGKYVSSFDTYADPSVDVEDSVLADIDRVRLQEKFFNLCQYFCKNIVLPDKILPEGILVFFYNKIVIPYFKKTKSGSPTEIQELFYKKTITEIRDMLITDLQMILGCKIPDYVFEELNKKIEQNSEYNNKIFSMENARISDVSYKAHRSVKEHIEKNKGGL